MNRLAKMAEMISLSIGWPEMSVCGRVGSAAARAHQSASRTGGKRDAVPNPQDEDLRKCGVELRISPERKPERQCQICGNVGRRARNINV